MCESRVIFNVWMFFTLTSFKRHRVFFRLLQHSGSFKQSKFIDSVHWFRLSLQLIQICLILEITLVLDKPDHLHYCCNAISIATDKNHYFLESIDLESEMTPTWYWSLINQKCMNNHLELFLGESKRDYKLLEVYKEYLTRWDTRTHTNTHMFNNAIFNKDASF